MHLPSLFGRVGLLPLAAPSMAFVATRLGALAFPRSRGGTASDRAVGGGLLALGLVIVGTRLLGLLQLLTPLALLVALGGATLLLGVAGRGARFGVPWHALAERESAWLGLPALGAVGIAVAAAWMLPIWQSDSVGYHLPYVNFALQAHATAGVPDGAPYIATYPHAIELYLIALRALLPDDRLIDLAQIPLALFGAIAAAGIARKAGARRGSALGAGLLWLVVPAVFLQMPTDYVDVGAAALQLAAIYFLLPAPNGPFAPPADEGSGMLACALGLGLYAASKPNAPLGAALLALGLLRRHRRSDRLPLLLVSLLGAALFASESLVSTALHHGNPLWPARIDLGPLHLPGRNALHELLESGASAPRLAARGPLWLRTLASWTSLDAPPICDMRYGGMGPIFLFALLPALASLVRLRSGLWALGVAAAAFAPDPSIARYVLALPAMIFALAAPSFDALVESPHAPRYFGSALSAALAAAACWQLGYAAPGLAGEGPPLSTYPAKSEAERLVAVGPSGRPDAYLAARARLRDGETFAFDSSFDLPYFAWDSDARHQVLFLPDELPMEQVQPFLDEHRVRVVAAGNQNASGRWLAAHPEQFERLFAPRGAPCVLYARR